MMRAVVACAALAVLAGCGEKVQVVQYKQGVYQGRADTRPYDNAPNSWSKSSWQKGDQASWESALKQRAQGQNEYLRSN